MALGQHQLVLHPNTPNESTIELLLLKKADIILRTLNHNLRLSIIRLLQERTQITVTEIYEELKLEQSVVSQHLAMLRRAGIVDTTRQGKYIFYTLKSERIEEIYHLAKAMIK